MTQAPAQFEDIAYLENKLKENIIPPDLKQKAEGMVERLNRLASAQGYSQEYDTVSRYLDWIVLVVIWLMISSTINAWDLMLQVADMKREKEQQG